MGYETIFHLFGSCEKLKGLWEILNDTHYLLVSKHFDYRDFRCNLLQFDLATIQDIDRKYEKTLIYLNTAVNYNIWRYRNDIRYKF